VASVLGVPVERFDYGTAPGQVDALVCYPDRVAALEVVADHEEAYTEQQDALHDSNDRIEVEGLRDSWTVLLSRRAKINKVRRALPAILLALQSNPPPRPSRLGYRTRELDRLGISSAWPRRTSTMPGRVYVLPQPWGGFAGTERTVGEWVTRVLGEQADVPKKLAEHPEVAERHAFIWATPTSDMAVQTQLEPGDDHPFPMKPPTLPAGVTHVWVAGHWCRGVLAWFPGRGWWRTALMWSSEGPATSTDLGD